MGKSCIGLLVIFVLSNFLFGCTSSAHKKVEMRDRLISESTKNVNYLKLARYWDENAEKVMISSVGATFLTVIEDENRAEITIGNGPYYGMMELIGVSENTTKIKIYAWGVGLINRFYEWKELIESVPEVNQHQHYQN